MNTKKECRAYYFEKRNLLGEREKHEKLAFMLETMRDIQYSGKAMVLSYMPMLTKNEVPPELFEAYLADEEIARGFCYPSANFATGNMQAYLDDDLLEWVEADFGLTQPGKGTLVNPDAIDLILVPLLAFDERGYRLGYGKGFYDRYLAQCRKDVLKIGLAWFGAEKRLPETSPHDVPLNYCVTPHKLYVF